METTPVRIEELLAHASWVRNLAARLVRDPAAAEDVTQEVWASALRSPPRERSNLRGWLGSAVRSAAHSMRRGETRRKARERLAPGSHEQPGPAELVERAQLHRELVEQVLALGEPHRSMVLAHWFEGSSIAAAGRRLGLSERVAKLRLDAAHALLRQRLDKKHKGREAWSVAFLNWTQSESTVAGTAGALTAGGIVLGTKMFVAGAAAVIAALAIVMWTRDHGIVSRGQSLSFAVGGESPAQTPADALAPPTAEEQRAAVHTSPREAPAPVAAPARPRWLARGRVSAAQVGSLDRTLVSAQFVGRWSFLDRGAVAASKEGAFEIDLTAMVESWLRAGNPSELQVTAKHPLCLISSAKVPFESADLDASDATGSTRVFHVDLTLTAAAVITGRVIVPRDWAPRSDLRTRRPRLAWVALHEPAASNGDPVMLDTASCDAEGRFTLRANHGGGFQLVAMATGLRAEVRSVGAILGASLAMEPIELAPGLSISGTVLKAGRPIGAGVEVCAEPRSDRTRRVTRFGNGWETLQLIGERLVFSHPITHTDASGRYVFDGLEPVEYDLYVGSLPDLRVGLGRRPHVERTVLAPQTNVDLSLLQPIVHFSCTIDGKAAGRTELGTAELTIVPLAPNHSGRSVEIAGSQVEIAVVEDTNYEFRVSAGRFEPVVVFVPALSLSEERDVHIDLKPRVATSSLIVRLVSKPGDTIDEAQFAFIDADAAPDAPLNWKSLAPEKDGTFVWKDLSPGPQRVRVLPWAAFLTGGRVDTPYLGTEFTVELLPDKAVDRSVELEVGSRLRLAAKDDRGGFVRAAVDLRDGRGDRVATRFYCSTEQSRWSCDWYLCEQGINDHPPLPAGHYELKLTADGFEDKSASFDLYRGETTTLEIPMRKL